MYKWHKITDNSVVHISQQDNCYYLVEYTAQARYKHSQANSRILNFKKNPLTENSQEQFYKKQAIEQFAQDISIAIEDIVKMGKFPL